MDMIRGLIGDLRSQQAGTVPLLPTGAAVPQLPGAAAPQLPPGGGAPMLLPPDINFDASAPAFKPTGKSRGVQKKTKPAKKSYYNVRITGPDGEQILTDEE